MNFIKNGQKLLLLVIILLCSNFILSQNCRDDDITLQASTSVFISDGLQLNAGIGKSIGSSLSSIHAELVFAKEYFYSKKMQAKTDVLSYAAKLSYFYSYRYYDPLYINIGLSLFVGMEQEKCPSFMVGFQINPQIEGRICDMFSLFIEPRLAYQFKTILREPLNISLCAGIKFYL